MWSWVSFKPFTLTDSKGALTSMPSRRTALGSATSTAYFRMVRGSRATPVACTHSMHVLSSNFSRLHSFSRTPQRSCARFKFAAVPSVLQVEARGWALC